MNNRSNPQFHLKRVRKTSPFCLKPLPAYSSQNNRLAGYMLNFNYSAARLLQIKSRSLIRRRRFLYPVTKHLKRLKNGKIILKLSLILRAVHLGKKMMLRDMNQGKKNLLLNPRREKKSLSFSK